jgi:phage FluMu protein Com
VALFKKKIKCPYCQNVLEKKPSRKTKCPVCKEYIYVRSQELVTEERANIIDELKRFDFTEEQYKNSENEVAKKFGHKPKCDDVIWNLCNKEIIKNRNDYSKLNSIYSNMAHFLYDRDKDCFQILQQAKKMKLLYLKSMGSEEVEIMGGGCTSSQELNGKIFKIDDALEQMPIPNKSCSNIRKNKKRAFCTCEYFPTSEEEREARRRFG